MSPPGKDDKFSIFVPKDEDEQRMPDYLEVVDTTAGGKPKDRLQGGAYDPYQKQDTVKPGDTARIRRPRVDLRRLSEWIKTTQKVKALREEDLAEREKARDRKPEK